MNLTKQERENMMTLFKEVMNMKTIGDARAYVNIYRLIKGHDRFYVCPECGAVAEVKDDK